MFKLCPSLRKFIGLMCMVCFVESSHPANEYPVPRVVNGNEARLGEFPYQIALKEPHIRVRGLYVAFCGATIIGLSKILTAAHCIVKEELPCEKYFSLSKSHRKLSVVYAVAGTLQNQGRLRADSASSEQWRHIRVAAVPQNYEFPTSDIAIAFTKEPFVFNKYVGPIPYATQCLDYGDVVCRVSGYGMIDKEMSSETLLWADLALIPSKRCSTIHGRNMVQFICTSSQVSSVLMGDSGGPLVCHNTTDPMEDQRGVVVGVVSGLREGAGTFFTKVCRYKKFIAQDGSARLSCPTLLLACITALQVSLLFH